MGRAVLLSVVPNVSDKSEVIKSFFFSVYNDSQLETNLLNDGAQLKMAQVFTDFPKGSNSKCQKWQK